MRPYFDDDPVIILEVENNPDAILHTAFGPRQDTMVYLSERDVDRIRAGYACMNCLTGLRHDPNPESCPICGFAVKDEQSGRFAREHIGEVHLGPSVSDEDELAEMQEMEDRQKRISSIWVPRSI